MSRDVLVYLEHMLKAARRVVEYAEDLCDSLSRLLEGLESSSAD